MSRFESTSWTIVNGAAEGSSVAREEFCRRYDGVIRTYLARRWRLSTVHDDVTEGLQEVLLECLRPEGPLGRVDAERPGGFRAYLYGVTSRTAVALERRMARARRGNAKAGFDPDRVERDEQTLSQAFDRGWAEMVGKEARRLLFLRSQKDPKLARRMHCLELRYVEGLPPRAIAEKIDCTPEQVYELLRGAKGDYRNALFEVMSSYFPGASEKDLENRCQELASLL